MQNGALDRVNARLKKIKFSATAGPHKIGVAFKRRTFAESDDQLQMFTKGGGQDRFYRVQFVPAAGTVQRERSLSQTPSRARIFVCKPAGGVRPPEAQAACAKQIIGSLAKQAYRRPVTAEDVNELLALLQRRRAGRPFEAGDSQRASPACWRVRSSCIEASAFRRDCVPATAYAIADLELASQLSFFIWNTIPDEELLQLAIGGKLDEPTVLDKQVKRMLADPRSLTLASNFVQQWLDMKRLDEIVPDSAVFPYASGRADPREDFRTELTLFADSIFREDRSVVDLLRAKHTFLNERIALHYGITDVKGDRFRRVELAQLGALGAAGQGRGADGCGVSRTARRRFCAARSSSSTFKACRQRILR